MRREIKHGQCLGYKFFLVMASYRAAFTFKDIYVATYTRRDRNINKCTGEDTDTNSRNKDTDTGKETCTNTDHETSTRIGTVLKREIFFLRIQLLFARKRRLVPKPERSFSSQQLFRTY